MGYKEVKIKLIKLKNGKEPSRNAKLKSSITEMKNSLGRSEKI